MGATSASVGGAGGPRPPCASSAMVVAMHHIQVACLVRHGRNDQLRATWSRRWTTSTSWPRPPPRWVPGGRPQQRVRRRRGRRYVPREKQAPVISYGGSPTASWPPPADRRTAPRATRCWSCAGLPGSGWSRWGSGTPWASGDLQPGVRPRASGDAGAILDDPYADISSRTMLPVAHILWSSLWLGIATAAMDRARRFVQAEARKRPGTTPAAAMRLADTAALHQQFADLVRSAACGSRRCQDDPDGPVRSGFAIAMNSLKVSASTLVVDVVRQCMVICGLAGVPGGHPLQPGPAPARLDGGVADGQQRPDHGQQRPDAPGPPGRVRPTGERRLGGSEAGQGPTSNRGTPSAGTCSTEGLLIPTGVDGLYGRSGTYEAVAEAMDRLVLRDGADQGATSVRFPRSCPGPRSRRTAISSRSPTRSVGAHLPGRRARRTPNCCAGPRSTRTGRRCWRPRTWCCARRSATRSTRHDAASCPKGVGGSRSTATASVTSRAPIRSGCRPSASTTTSTWAPPRGRRAHRDLWIERGLEVLAGSGWRSTRVVANDPFFGRPGRMLAANQRERGAEAGDRDAHVRLRPAHGHLVVQLPSGPLRPTVRDRVRRRARWPTPPASASAWTGSPWPCCIATASTPTAGRPGSGRQLWP